MNIDIIISNKIATAANAPVIVCGNSDYVVNFTFDSEWESYDIKTARFTYRKNGSKMYIDVLITDNACNAPIFTNIDSVEIGVYAGDLSTTTGAKIACRKSILCGNEKHDEPTQDVYNQIIQLLEENYPLEAALKADKAAENAENTVEDAVENLEAFKAETHNDIQERTNQIKEHNYYNDLTFWIGTQAEYDALDEIVTNRIYYITDEDTIEKIEKYFADTKQEIEDYFQETKQEIEETKPNYEELKNRTQPIDLGGTGANTVEQALSNLGLTNFAKTQKGTYDGTEQLEGVTLNYDFSPNVVIIIDETDLKFAVFIRGLPAAIPFEFVQVFNDYYQKYYYTYNFLEHFYPIDVNWSSEKTFSFKYLSPESTKHFNKSGVTYKHIALG